METVASFRTTPVYVIAPFVIVAILSPATVALRPWGRGCGRAGERAADPANRVPEVRVNSSADAPAGKVTAP